MAIVFGKHVLGVILSGHGEDGAIGASIIRAMDGSVIAQDRRTSAAFDMPRAVLRAGAADLILPLDKIASAIIAFGLVPGAAELFRGEREL